MWAYLRHGAKETAVMTTELADIGRTLSQLHATWNSSFQVTMTLQLVFIGCLMFKEHTYYVSSIIVTLSRVLESYNCMYANECNPRLVMQVHVNLHTLAEIKNRLQRCI